ncbi:MAG: type II toxin-antitoxin system RelB/DinJ family antitoxin [Candidatus Anammoxibacter sp.]
MNKSATIHARIEPKIKEKAEGVLKKLGISPAEVIRLFYDQICRSGGIPFQILIPNETTIKTLRRRIRRKDIQSFGSLKKMFKSW